MSADIPPLSPDLAQLFEAERGYDEAPSADVRARLLAGIRGRIASPDGDGGGSGSNGGGAASAGGRSIAMRTAAAGMIATFVVGALVGAALMRAPEAASRREPPPPAPTFTRPRSATANPGDVAAVATAASALAPESDVVTASASGSAPAPVHAPSASGIDDGHGAAAERALLDSARIALSSGEPERALEIVDRHLHEYPHGRLAEEREAIAIRALVKVGRYDEARTRATRFDSVYPRSVAAPAVSAALTSIPR